MFIILASPLGLSRARRPQLGRAGRLLLPSPIIARAIALRVQLVQQSSEAEI
jgi:hypothetical protein